MKKLIQTGLFAAVCAASANAAALDVQIKNLTKGIAFTPVMVVAHTDQDLFSVGSEASADIKSMAEGGSLDGLAATLTAAGATQAPNPAGGLLMPGSSAVATLDTTGTSNGYLSVVAMMLPTNDGFVGLNNWKIPTEAGTYTVRLNAYDAGTEANDEVRGGGGDGEAGFPVPGPIDGDIGMSGTGITGVSAEGFVHIHRGVLGDTDSSGGVSDIDAAKHRWLNPVAEVIVTVN